MSRLAAIGALLTAGPVTAFADPFLVRNQHPFVALYGLPGPLPSRLATRGQDTVVAAVQWSSFEATGRKGSFAYTLDGEAVDARLHVDRELGSGWALHAELAHRSLGAGSLDDVIAGWHDLFGLPDGSRNRLPDDYLLIAYRDDGGTLLQVDTGRSGIADIPVALGWQVVANERSAIAAWVSLKAPVGSAKLLTGSGAFDAAASMSAGARPTDRWSLFAQLNFAWLGQGDLLTTRQESHAWSSLTGVTWHAWRGLDLTAQLEANSAVLDTGLDDLDGDALVLTFGGSYRAAGRWRFDLAISEDVQVDASPDVVFNLALRRGF